MRNTKTGILRAEPLLDGTYAIYLEMFGLINQIGKAKDKSEAQKKLKQFKSVRVMSKFPNEDLTYIEASCRMLDSMGILKIKREDADWHIELGREGLPICKMADGKIVPLEQGLTDQDREASDWMIIDA